VTRLRDPRQAAAILRQRELEQQAAAKRQAEHNALLARMPDDLREMYQVGLGVDFVCGLLKRGMFPNDTHDSVHEGIAFMTKHVHALDQTICAHPRFAEFFPEQAAKLAARNAAREALEKPAPQLVGPDGAPLDLAAAPGIIHVDDPGMH